MTLLTRVYGRAAEQHGFLTPADVREAGGSPMALVMLARRGTVEHVDRGLYRIPELAGGPFAREQEALLRLPGGVLSHDTALAVADLADVNPQRVHVTMPHGYQLRKRIPAWIVLHRAHLEPGEIDAVAGLAVTTPARSILDALAGHTGRRFTEQAFVTARERKLLTAPEERRVRRALAGRGAEGQAR